MEYAIVYSSKTGNTKVLANAVQNALPQSDCVYFGHPDDAALLAERLYIGFWTDKGGCDAVTGDFLAKVKGKEVFLFGTAGFGGADSYFEKILKKVSSELDDSNMLLGTYMCQGKMPMSVRERYENMLEAHAPVPNLNEMIENFDRALSHPNQTDLEQLKNAVLVHEKKTERNEEENEHEKNN